MVTREEVLDSLFVRALWRVAVAVTRTRGHVAPCQRDEDTCWELREARAAGLRLVKEGEDVVERVRERDVVELNLGRRT